MPGAEFDDRMMLRCLELARKAEGRTSPNPMVGAVVVDDCGNVIGEGFHKKAGQAHAEVHALEMAGERAVGATLYVNLEPCSHFGRTPPCADRVVESGIKRVVAGMQDPNPRVCGQGTARLRAAGIEVEYSRLEEDCRELNRAFVKRMLTGLPWLSLKMASTLDGRIADYRGNSRWISGSQARCFVHQLRNTTDCVLIGGRTAVIDDPELTVREIENGRNPRRAVVDPDLTVRPDARVCRHKAAEPDENEMESWTAIFARTERVKDAPPFPEKVKLVEIADNAECSFLRQSLGWLAGNGVLSVLCEGGGRLAAALLEEHLVDEVFWIIAPMLFVDAQGVPVLSGKQSVEIGNALRLKNFSCEQLGADLLIRGRL